MRFSSEFLQHLKTTISLVDVASENIELRKTGNRYMGRCPFHGDRSPSFSVNRDFYYCFGCKETGDVISFVTKLHGLSFEEAVEDLAEKARIPLPEGDSKLSSAEEKALVQKRLQIQKGARLNYFASLKFYHANLLQGRDNPLFQEAREYLKKRGISQKIIDQFQVGVAGSQSDGLVQFLTKAKAPLEIARQFQLIRASQKTTGDYDFFRERLLFPLIDVRGRVCGFGGRILPSIEKRPSEMKLPKYLNTAESDLFQKSKFLYGLYQAKRAIREEEVAIIVEGYFDTIAMVQHGVENVVAPCGTSFTDDHLKTLSRLAKKIIVFFDQDEAGINATTKAMELGLKSGLLMYGIDFQSKLDPDEFLLENPVEHLAKLKTWITDAKPLLDTLIEKMFLESENNLETRTQAIKQASAWLGLFADPVGRAVRVDQLISKWKVPEVALQSLRGGSRVLSAPRSAQVGWQGQGPGGNHGPSQNLGSASFGDDPFAAYGNMAEMSGNANGDIGGDPFAGQGGYPNSPSGYSNPKRGNAGGSGYGNASGGRGGYTNAGGRGQAKRGNYNGRGQNGEYQDRGRGGRSRYDDKPQMSESLSAILRASGDPNPGMPARTQQNSGRGRRPIPLPDRELLQFLVKFKDFGNQFLEARKQLPEKDTLAALFEDTEVKAFIVQLAEDPTGFSKLKQAPEAVMTASISQELRSVIMEGLLDETPQGAAVQLEGLLKRSTYKAWARFSHNLRQQIAAADSAQDTEKLKELSEQFLDLQRKLKEFEDSYVSGKTD